MKSVVRSSTHRSHWQQSLDLDKSYRSQCWDPLLSIGNCSCRVLSSRWTVMITMHATCRAWSLVEDLILREKKRLLIIIMIDGIATCCGRSRCELCSCSCMQLVRRTRGNIDQRSFWSIHRHLRRYAWSSCCSRVLLVSIYSSNTKVDEKILLIGHRSRCEAILRVFEEDKVRGVVLVAAGRTDLDEDEDKYSEYYNRPWYVTICSTTDDQRCASPQGEANGDRTRSERTIRTRFERVDRNVFMRSKRVHRLVRTAFVMAFERCSGCRSLILRTPIVLYSY